MLSLSQITVTNLDFIRPISLAGGTQQNRKGRKEFGISFCTEGRIQYEQNGKIIISDTHHAAFLPQGGYYKLKTLEASSTLLLDFHGQGDGLSDSIHSIALSEPENYLQILRHMMLLQPIPQNRAKLMSLLYELFHRMDTEQARSSDPIQPSVEYLHRNFFREDLSNATLALASGVSEVYFRKRFTQRFGVSPHRYLLDLRIQRAKQLLAEGEQSVSQIAEACGFTNVYHFSRTFKSNVGVTPTQYAMQSRQALI